MGPPHFSLLGMEQQRPTGVDPMNLKEREESPLILIDQTDDSGWIRGLSPSGHSCSVGRITCGRACFRFLEAHSRANAYTVAVHLARYPGHELWCDQRPMRMPAQAAGTLSIYDRAYRWAVPVSDPCDCIVFHFPGEALSQASDEDLHWHIDMQGEPVRFGLPDHVMHHLALAMLPAFSHPLLSDAKYVEPLLGAAVAHLGRTYGRAQPQDARECGQLAPWQIRRVKELVATHLEVRIGVADLADACRLSPSHFTLLFKRTVGSTPHQWLLDQRIARAKSLLRSSCCSLAEIAYATGFADQSHFARVFAQRERTSPQAWRRQFAGKRPAIRNLRAVDPAGAGDTFPG